MTAPERPVCPACFRVLPATRPDETLTHCPACGYELPKPGDLQQTAAHTPVAKRKSNRPED